MVSGAPARCSQERSELRGRSAGVGVGPSSRDAQAVPGLDAWLLRTLGGDSHFKHLGPCHPCGSPAFPVWAPGVGLARPPPLRAPAVSQMEGRPFHINICVVWCGLVYLQCWVPWLTTFWNFSSLKICPFVSSWDWARLKPGASGIRGRGPAAASPGALVGRWVGN